MSEPGSSHLWAKWSCWWGSPQLVAQAVRKAESAIAAAGPQQRPRGTITLTVGADRERFESTDSFLAGATPEALRSFSLLELHVRGNGIDLRACFDRRRRSRLGGGRGQAVHLEVIAVNGARESDACEVARAVAVSLGRGYSRYWAKSECSPMLREQVGRPLPGHDAVTMVVVGLVGALLGAGLARLLDDLPGVELSSLAMLAVLACVGTGYPVLVSRLVPSVEVAHAGHTRLLSVGRKSAAALATFIATHALQVIAGAG
jgi:hypothetical protein